MKIKTLKKNNKKKWIIGSIVVIALIVTITYIGTRAKYKTTNSIPIARGTINYKYDLELLAVKLQNDEGTYDNIDTVPTNGYILNKDLSTCKVGNKKVEVPIDYKGRVYVGVIEKGTKCELYFDKSEFLTKDLILSNNIIDDSRASGAFTEPFSEDTAGRIFNSIDDDGTTYFFAGSNPNNWVKFGTNKEGQDLYWRIIRINGDNSIRIIYNGPSTSQTGTSTQIGTSAFNTRYDDNKYVGYMYDNNTVSSTIKESLDNWYEENLKLNYEQYIDTNAGFCGDRGIHSGTGTGTTYTEYVAYNRTYLLYTPTYKCANESNDLYTTSDSIKGNKRLTNPLGLITIDEVYYVGTYNNIPGLTYNHWLKTDQFYWANTPGYYSINTYIGAFGFNISPSGYINANFMSTPRGVRPVINLKLDVLTTGSGTADDPYRIV